MPAYNFRKRFVAAIESGKKRQTIRAARKAARIAPGQTAYLYTGMRTKHCRKLGEFTITEIVNIFIDQETAFISDLGTPICDALVNDLPYLQIKAGFRDAFAQADGFADWQEMVAWFAVNHGLPFVGHLIEWGGV